MNEEQDKLDASGEIGQGDPSGCGALPDDPDASNAADDVSVKKERLRGGLGIYADPAEGFDIYEKDFFEPRIPVRNMHWSIAWSDLMMTMFILFLVMFVYKNADREFLSGEGGGSFLGKNVGKEALDFGSRKTQEFNVFGEKAFSKTYDFSKLTNLEKELKEFAAIDLEPDKTLRIILTGDLLFPVGKTELMADSLNFLKKIAIFLKETPYKINVVGHTDNLPISTANIPSNWELSANRASAVARYLIAETKLPASQFYVTGHAEFLPVAPNTTSGGRAKNRRVEIVVTKEMPGALPLGSADL